MRQSDGGVIQSFVIFMTPGESQIPYTRQNPQHYVYVYQVPLLDKPIIDNNR